MFAVLDSATTHGTSRCRLHPPQPILDAPDGLWTVDVKNDIFRKVGGSVRATELVANASYYYKNYIAVASVLAEMDLEERLLSANDL
jgi:hypothetical protein